MRVVVHWRWLEHDTGPEWDATDRLFAFADPESDEILYVGAATGATVRQCCEAADLEPVWRDLRGIGIEHVSVLVGAPASPRGRAIAPADVAAAAALLVAQMQPAGNADTEMPDARLEIECTGDWPYEETRFESD